MEGSEKERIFVHEAAWAYCAAGRRAPTHQWIPTGGLLRQRLESGVRRREDP